MIRVHRRSVTVGFASLAVFASLGLTACRGGTARASDADIQKWLAAVQNFSNDADQGQDCYLLARGQLVSDMTHPSGTWTVTGTNDQTTDSHRGFGCSIKADGQAKGYGQIGIALTSSVGSASTEQRVGVLEGTRWSLYESAWPGRAPSPTEFARVMRDAEINLSTAPPDTTPEEGVLAGPEDPITTK